MLRQVAAPRNPIWAEGELQEPTIKESDMHHTGDLGLLVGGGEWDVFGANLPSTLLAIAFLTSHFLSPVPCLAMGRYVSIVLAGGGKILTLCEVQVLGTMLPCDSTTGQCIEAHDGRQVLRDMVKLSMPGNTASGACMLR